MVARSCFRGLSHSSAHIVVLHGTVDALHACLQRSEPDGGTDRDADPMMLQAGVVALEDTDLIVMPFVAEGVAGSHAYAQVGHS